MGEVTKKRIMDLLKKFIDNRHAHPTAVHRALKFIRDMDDEIKLPKIAYDEDGDILLVWDENPHTLIIMLEPDKWHIYNLDGEILDDQKYIDNGVDPAVHELLKNSNVRGDEDEK